MVIDGSRSRETPRRSYLLTGICILTSRLTNNLHPAPSVSNCSSQVLGCRVFPSPLSKSQKLTLRQHIAIHFSFSGLARHRNPFQSAAHISDLRQLPRDVVAAAKREPFG